ncbi:MFS transporter [Candidatus Bathyarchaeota archaeon]|nr:MFS transporter [Candidatus Bathyarchaeota archaeon]
MLKIYNRTVLILAGLQFIQSIAMGLPMSFFPNYAVSLGASIASIGIFTSSFMLSAALMAPRMGGLADKYGRKKLMMLGIFSDIILGVLTGLAPSWEWLLFIRFVNGAVSSGAMLAADALLQDNIEPENRGETAGFMMAAGMVGRNIGPLIGGTVQWLSINALNFDILTSYRVPYFVDSGFSVLLILLVYFFIKEPKEHHELMQRAREAGGKLVYTDTMKVILINAFMMGIGVGFIMPIMVLFYNDKFGMGALEIGTIMSISGFIGLFASFIAGRFADKMGRKPLIIIGNYLSQFFGFILPFTGNPTQAGITMSARSLGFNMSQPAFQALRADLVPPQHRGAFFGQMNRFFTAGDVIGPIIGAWIYSQYRTEVFNLAGIIVPGIGITFFINSLIGFLGTTTLLLFVKEPKPEERATRLPNLVH